MEGNICKESSEDNKEKNENTSNDERSNDNFAVDIAEELKINRNCTLICIYALDYDEFVLFLFCLFAFLMYCCYSKTLNIFPLYMNVVINRNVITIKDKKLRRLSQNLSLSPRADKYTDGEVYFLFIFIIGIN